MGGAVGWLCGWGVSVCWGVGLIWAVKWSSGLCGGVKSYSSNPTAVKVNLILC